jgi:hypothetical protein
MFLALIPITVIMQVASEVAIKSVGEKRSPFPLLSTGASVSKLFPERRCVQTVLSSPSYSTVDVILFCLNLRSRTYHYYSVKKIILFVLLLSSGVSLFAQDSTNINRSSPRQDKKAEKRQRINAIIKQEEEGNLSFRKQSAFGIELRTNGYGIFYELGKRKSARYTNLYSIEITEIKHRKEEKIGGDQFFSNSFVFGKIYNFYQGKLGFGQQYILGQKGNKNGVAVTVSLQGGLDLGLLKPYYVDVEDSAGVDRSVSYAKDPGGYMTAQGIFGGSGFTKGFNELKVKPGVFVKSALRFDFGRYNESLQAMEIGVSAEAFSQKIPLMIYNDPKQFFVQMHVAIVFGGRR